MSQPAETIETRIWKEIPESDNPFAAHACYCQGYDVYKDILKKASWTEYLYLLFHGERPTEQQAKLLETLAIALANPGPRDHSVRAAMTSGVGGSSNAASLMAALAVGAGELGGAREVYLAVGYWKVCDTVLEQWEDYLTDPPQSERADVWLPMEHPPGFDPYADRCAKPVIQVLEHLCEISSSQALAYLKSNRPRLEQACGFPLAMSGVAAAALFDLGFSPDQAEMLFLLLRLPGAAVHALEQKQKGWRKYPFFHNGIVLTNDPIQGG